MSFPSLNTLRTFEAAARHLSFNRAADELCISPSAVSHQIRQLEHTLGIRLFLRSERRVSLTQKGEFYFKNVQQGIQILVQATNSLTTPMREHTIRISAVPFFATRWLMRRLDTFQAHYPGWELAIQTSTQKSEFDREDLDLVIRRGAGDWPGMIAHLLLRESLVPVCAPAMARTIDTIVALKGATLLHNSQVPSEWSEWFGKIGHTFSAPTAKLEFQNSSQILEACIAGVGIALMDRQLIFQEMAEGRIQSVVDQQVDGMRNYYLVYPKSHTTRKSVQIFLEWISNELEQMDR